MLLEGEPRYFYQTVPSPRQSQLDFNLNPEFNRGNANLAPHQNLHPFAKKSEIPVVYEPQRVLPLSPSNQSYINTSNYPGGPSYQQEPVFYNSPNYVHNQAYSSTYSPFQPDHSQILRYRNSKTRSANDTYPDSSSSFSYNIERSIEAVNCVICDKSVNRQLFNAHLEEHKGRRNVYQRSDGRIVNEPTSKMASFQVRNQHSMGGVADIYKEHPSGQSNKILNSRNDSSRNPNQSISLSRQIEESESSLVYVPRDPSKLLNSQHSPSSALNYSKSSGYESRPNQSRPLVQVQARQPSLHHPSLSMQNLSKRQPSQYVNRSLNQSNRINSLNVLPSDLTRRNEAEVYNRGNPPTTSQNNHLFQSVKRPLHIRQSKVQVTPEYNISLTQSQIVKPSTQKYSLEDCDQSMINHLTQISRYSKQSSIGELKRQLNIQRIAEEDSSDDEEMYYSVKPSSFEKKGFTSRHPALIKKNIQDSRHTNGLSRSRLPINNLAVQQFIQNPLTYSCYRSTHRL